MAARPAVSAAAHRLEQICQDHAQQCLIGENRSRPAVLFFFHLPKTGGTAVRTIFERAGWHLTLWSLSQHRFLRAIEDALISANSTEASRGCSLRKPKHCAARIFVEWHLSPFNMSFLTSVEQRVLELRPDALFRSFLLLRDPIQYVTSNGAFWRPHLLAEDVVMLGPELLLFELLNAGSKFQNNARAWWTVNGTSDTALLHLNREQLSAVQQRAPAALQAALLRTRQSNYDDDNATSGIVLLESDLPPCAAALDYTRCQRIGKMEAAQRDHYIRERKGHPIRPDEHTHVRREVERELRRADNRRAYVKSKGCSAVTASALAALSNVDHILLLSDVRTMPTVQAAALGDLSFRPLKTWLSEGLKPPVQLVTPKARKDKFYSPATMQVALRENVCSLQFFQEVSKTRLWPHLHSEEGLTPA